MSMRALSKNPADRYQTAEEFAAALRRARRPVRAPGDGVTAAGASAGAGAARAPRWPPARPGSASSPRARAARPRPRPGCPGLPPSRPRPRRRVPPRRRPSRRRRRPPRRPWSPRRRPPATAPAESPPRPSGRAAAAGCGAWCSRSSWSRSPPPASGRPTCICSPPARPSRPWSASAAPTPPGRCATRACKPELHYVWADRYAAGEVARQAPRGGAKVEDGVKVDLWVSRGPLHIPSPDLTGLAASVARGRLEARVAQQQESQGRFGDHAQGPDLPAAAGRRCDRGAWRHRHLLGEQRAAEGLRARRRRSLPGRRLRDCWRTPASW